MHHPFTTSGAAGGERKRELAREAKGGKWEKWKAGGCEELDFIGGFERGGLGLQESQPIAIWPA